MYQLSPEMGNVPPHWLAYFAVDDTDAMLKKVADLGGTVIAPPMDIPGTGRFAIVRDPHGATFGIIKLNSPPA
jgi:predicted enzyme related to lactoylglutathione lyase